MLKMEEKQFIINLRREFIKAPSYKKSMKAVKAIREFVMHHMKAQDVRVCTELNRKIWERGSKNPIHKVTVKVKQDGDVLWVQLPEFEFPKKKEKKLKAEKKEGLAGKLQEKLEEAHNKDEMKKVAEDKKLEEHKHVELEPSKELKKTKAKAAKTTKEGKPAETGKKQNEKKVRNF